MRTAQRAAQRHESYDQGMANPRADWNNQIISQFRANGGHVDKFGDNLLLVHHLGAKSGTERVNPLVAIRLDHDTWWITASAGGREHNPDWLYNLKAHPDITVEIPGEGSANVRARVLEGSARDEAYTQFKAYSPSFSEYEKRAPRVIPVVELSRITV